MARPSRNEIDDLLNKSERLVPNIGGQTRLRRSLPQVELASEQLFDQMQRSSGAAQRKGLTLLAQNRVDTEAHQKSRELLDFQHNTSTESYVADTDIETHLKLNQDTLIVHALEESMQDTIHLHEWKVNKRLTDDWNQAREELLSAVGQYRGGAATYGNFGKRPTDPPSAAAHLQFESTLPLAMPGVQRALSKFSGRERAYLGVVEEMNRARIASQPSKKLELRVINKFLSNERNTSGQVRSTLDDQRQTAWELLEALVDETQKPMPESFYSGWERDDERLKGLLHRNIKFLEKVWRESYLGDGSEGPIEEEKFAQKFPQNYGQKRDPWGIVYCYLRCGMYDSAITVMQNIITESNCEGYDRQHCRHSDEMHSVLVGLRLWKERMEGRGRRNREETDHVLALESRIKQAHHPQKKAVLTLLCQINGGEQITNRLGKQELKPISYEIESASEDFLWRNLCVILALYGESKFDLSNLSSVIKVLYGPENFDDYFTVLLHCFEFEKAISYLCLTGRHFDAVHFAIALNHYGLLKRSYDDRARYALNQQRLGVYMTGENKFRLGQMFYDHFEQYNDHHIGVHYLALLYKEGVEPCVTEESSWERNRFLAKMLNHVQLDVLTQIIGPADQGIGHSLLDKYIKDSDQVTRIIKLAAHEADEKHATERAIRLHVKASQFNRAYDLVNRELGQFGKGMEDQLKEAKRFQEIIKRLNVEPKLIDERKQRTLGLLIDMWSFFKYEREADYRSALNISSVVELIESEPLKKRQKLNDYDDSVTRNVDDLCLAYMRCLVNKFQAEPSERGECKIKAEALFSFAQDPKRQLRYDTREQLQRLHSQIY